MKGGLQLPDSGAPVSGDGRRHAPSAERNIGAILDALRPFLAQAEGLALEIASGTGQHAVALARAFPALAWQPTDVAADNLRSITAWAAADPQPNLRPPLLLDACVPGWAGPHGGNRVVLLVNLLHLVPEPAAARLLADLPRALAPGGLAAIYGPFLRDGAATSPGDAAFDASLRAQDPAIGYKDAGWLADSLAAAGLDRVAVIEMPANNLLFLARRPV